MKRKLLFSILIIVVLMISSCFDQVSDVKFSPEEFSNPKPECNVHTWWHWMDGAITREGITKDLETMKMSGIGQATILNIGLFNGKDFGVKRLVFNSPEWHKLFVWALTEANRLGISIGAHNCDGWSTSGGPWISPEMSMKQFVWTKTFVSGGKPGDIKLPVPNSEMGFYKDVVVLAYKTKLTENSFRLADPLCKINNSPVNNSLFDGNPSSAFGINNNDKISFSFSREFKAEKIVIHPRKQFMWSDMKSFSSTYVISSSMDGLHYEELAEIEVRGLNESVSAEIPMTSAKHFQVEVKNISRTDAFIKFNIAEIEFLPADEKPSFYQTIPGLLEKSVSVKASDKTAFNHSDPMSASPIGLSIDEITDLTGKMDENGILNWSVPEGNWCILRFGYTTTGAMNGPATAEGTGLECDKMDTVALNLHFNSFPQKLIDNAGAFAGNTFKFLLIDSWECGYQNWTSNLPSEFEKTCGYSINSWIPVLCGETVGDIELSEAFLYDFRKTIAGMIENNYYKHFRDLCHRQNIEMHAEIIYGDANYPPLEILRTNSYVDLPMFEFWAGHNRNTFTEYTPSKPFESFPVFAALNYNIPVVGSEAYTGMAHYSESFRELKPFGDRAFCSGINQMILHSYVHQPLDLKPGMTLGQFGSHFNRNNITMQHASEWMKYQSRVQYILQKGEISSNLLYFIGDQLPQYLENEMVNTLPFGYRAMACNIDLLKSAKVRKGKIVLENGLEYGLLILPVSVDMELSSLECIAELVNQGAIVVGNKPVSQLSMTGISRDKESFRELADKVWGEMDKPSVTENSYGKGMVCNGISLADILFKSGILPDFKTNFPDSVNLIYIHKKYAGNDVYFVANQTDKILTRECFFAVGPKSPQIWKPMDGTISAPAVFSLENDIVSLPVNFQPGESMFFIFENQKPSEYFEKVFSGDKQIFPSQSDDDDGIQIPLVSLDNDKFRFSFPDGGEYRFVSTGKMETNKVLKKNERFEIIDFDGTVEFVPGYEAAIPPIKIKELKSFTDSEDPAIKYFSGTAKYTIRFSLTENFADSADAILLDLGKFESTARITLNRTELGVSWMQGKPFSVKGVLQKENILEVEVANVYRNRIIGDFIQYKELKNVWTAAPVQDFLDAGKPLKPSGLIGPLTIISEYID